MQKNKDKPKTGRSILANERHKMRPSSLNKIHHKSHSQKPIHIIPPQFLSSHTDRMEVNARGHRKEAQSNPHREYGLKWHLLRGNQSPTSPPNKVCIAIRKLLSPTSQKHCAVVR